MAAKYGGQMMSEKIPLSSQDAVRTRLEALRELFPEAFADGRVDLERLKQALGQAPDEGRERFGLSWAGKGEAVRNAQAVSTATLKPVPEKSVRFHATRNLLIAGDNLEVLKTLQKSYYGRVKMIYIDPPYNTGNEFIYADNFRDGRQEYLRDSGQVGSGGIRLTTNPETDGRYHSRWLNMMYPRLFLARQLLRDDGLIFVSIDDHEAAHLRLLMNEIFGEENFIAQFVWQSKKGGGSDVSHVVTDHQYVIAYARNLESVAVAKQAVAAEPLDLADAKGPYRKGRELNKWGSGSRREDRPTMYFPIPGPNGEDVYPIRSDGTAGRWRYGKAAMLDFVQQGDVLYERREDGTYIVYEKIRKTDPRRKPFRSWLAEAGSNAEGTETCKALFDGKSPFDFPKPLSLIQHLLQIGTRPDTDDIVMDFFAGSGTTAHAVLAQNQADGGNRMFILVQLPEPTGNAEFPTIADITRERVQRAMAQIGVDAAAAQTNLDLGFKWFRLHPSHFQVWDSAGFSGEPAELARQLRCFAHHVQPGATQLGILYEILLRAGMDLNAGIQEITVDGAAVYAIAGGLLLVCLVERVTPVILRALADLNPRQVVCLDSAFAGSDVLKVNTRLAMQACGIDFRTI